MFLRRLLVAVDFTPRSQRALAWGFELAAAEGADVDVVHVVPGPGQLRSAVDGYLGRAMPHAAASTVAQAREELRQLVETVAHRGIAPRLLIESGDPAAVIVRTAVESAADLIVMGTRGHRGMAEVMLGSVAHNVIACARCPVATLGDNR